MVQCAFLVTQSTNLCGERWELEPKASLSARPERKKVREKGVTVRFRCGFHVLLAVSLIGIAAGCGGNNSATISGIVTYDGQPVGDGTITFLPADGKGQPAGGPIVNGRYSLTGVLPGSKMVQITAVKAVKFAQSSAEMAQQAAERKARGDATGLIESADAIPANAVGNNTTIEVKPGTHTHDFALTKPTGPAGR
jgi:hypothetical protein